MLCRYCGAPLTWKRTAGGWLHAEPLALFRVSRREADDIRRDPPPPHNELGRQTHLHPAKPER
jgi:hypothetical protein